jgi:hypothetical protein
MLYNFCWSLLSLAEETKEDPMTKNPKLERLSSPLFKPLASDELTLVMGGSFTFKGRTQEGDGSVVNDYTEE